MTIFKSRLILCSTVNRIFLFETSSVVTKLEKRVIPSISIIKSNYLDYQYQSSFLIMCREMPVKLLLVLLQINTEQQITS